MQPDAYSWDETRERAASLVAAAQMSETEIAVEVGVSVATLRMIASEPPFKDRVAEIAEIIQRQVVRLGIASKQNRIDEYNRRWQGLKQIMYERSIDPNFQAVPGGKTGLLAQDIKPTGRGMYEVVYAIDDVLMSQMLNLEKQAAQELGQWAVKHEITGPGGGPIRVVRDVIAEIDEYERAFARAIARSENARSLSLNGGEEQVDTAQADGEAG